MHTTATATSLGASSCFSASMCSLSAPAPSLRSTLISATRTLASFIDPTARRTRRSSSRSRGGATAAAAARRRRLLNPAVANPLATEEDWENQRARAALYGHECEGSETWLAVGAPEEGAEEERGWEAVDGEALRRQMARSRENLLMRREDAERRRRGVRAVWV